MDVDGILTDGSIYIGADDLELKRFTVEDGVYAICRSNGCAIVIH